MEGAFSNDFQSTILKFLRPIRKNEKIGKSYQDTFHNIVKKIRNEIIKEEFITQMLEAWQNNKNNPITIIIAWISGKSTRFEDYIGGEILSLQHWKINNSMISAYILIFQASIYIQRGDYISGKNCLNYALYIFYETTGEDHPLVSVCMIRLAECYYHNDKSQNSILSSLKLLEKALALRMKNIDWYQHQSIIDLLAQIQSLRAQLNLP